MTENTMKTLAWIVFVFSAFSAGLIFRNTALYDPAYESYEEIPERTVEASEAEGNENESEPHNKGTEAISYFGKIHIPSIGVDADVESLGLTKEGDMATPYSFRNVGWYKNGARPGDVGNAVLSGHVDNGLGMKGVFGRLHEVNEGDEIFIRENNGKVSRFIVTGKELYDFESEVPEIWSKAGEPKLRLITCVGAWVPEEGTMDQRLVVTAKYANE